MLIGAIFTDEVALIEDPIPSFIINFAGLLTVLCLCFLFAFFVSKAALLFANNRSLYSKFESLLGEKIFGLIWIVPTAAMFLSLVMSEYLGFVPCRLCWYQRIFMYSLAVMMLFYYFKRQKWLRVTGYIWCFVGASIALYHRLVEVNPQFESNSCDPSVPCASPWFHAFGIFTLASMAFVAFVTTAVLLFMSANDEKSQEKVK